MKKTDVDILKDLISGLAVSGGRLKGDLLRQLREEELIYSTSHGSRVSYRAVAPEYLTKIFGKELAAFSLSESDGISRADLVERCGDSKILNVRSCPGFPVNSYEAINSRLCGKNIVISPSEGSFLFVSDWQHFEIPPDVVVVGVENMENFRCAVQMKHLFERFCAPILFVSRYPQSGDLVKWLSGISNRYVHFGDLDLAGIHIFLNEFHRYLGERAEFFIPADAEQRLAKGSRRRYDDQLPRFCRMVIDDPRVGYLADLIHKYHRGYDQEGFLK